MTTDTEAPTIERIDSDECFVLLRDRRLGRVAVKPTREIIVFPVYYAAIGEDLVFRTAPGTKLDAAVMRARVTFEIDSAVPAWSVLAHGYAEEIRDHGQQVDARACLGN